MIRGGEILGYLLQVKDLSSITLCCPVLSLAHKENPALHINKYTIKKEAVSKEFVSHDSNSYPETTNTKIDIQYLSLFT